MQTENLSRPGQVPAVGDSIRVLHPSGATETKWYCPPPPPVEVPIEGG